LFRSFKAVDCLLCFVSRAVKAGMTIRRVVPKRLFCSTLSIFCLVLKFFLLRPGIDLNLFLNLKQNWTSCFYKIVHIKSVSLRHITLIEWRNECCLFFVEMMHIFQPNEKILYKAIGISLQTCFFLILGDTHGLFYHAIFSRKMDGNWHLLVKLVRFDRGDAILHNSFLQIHFFSDDFIRVFVYDFVVFFQVQYQLIVVDLCCYIWFCSIKMRLGLKMFFEFPLFVLKKLHFFIRTIL